MSYIVKEATSKEELNELFHLRYREMLLEFGNTNDLEIDKTDYDDLCRQIICIDTDNNNKIIASYRMALSDEVTTRPFVCAREFDYSIIENKRNIELSRAFVVKEYRNGGALLPLWKYIFEFALNNHYDYILGDASFNSVNKMEYQKEISFLSTNYGFDGILPKDNIPMEFIKDVTFDEVKKTLPPLIKAYMMFGAKFSKGAYEDHGFGSVDIFCIIDLHDFNLKYVKHLLKF